jgi:hypothetical protein
MNKDILYKLVKDFIENADVPLVKAKLIVNYDEQYLKINGRRAYRLTLLDHETGQPIAEERHRRIDADTILDVTIQPPTHTAIKCISIRDVPRNQDLSKS